MVKAVFPVDPAPLPARTVAEALGVLCGAPKTVTVAGTNGKGSVVALLTAGLKAMGQVVGTYASPHLLRFNERISIDEGEAEDAEIVAAFEHIEAARGDVSLTYFESTTLAALWLFRQRKVDVQVLEVGLGGRLDAVNILDADVSVITSIGLDHVDWLGPDRASISREKAGIARQNRPCIVAESDPPDALLAALNDRGADILLIDRDWHIADRRLQTVGGRNAPLPAASGLLPGVSKDEGDYAPKKSFKTSMAAGCGDGPSIGRRGGVSGRHRCLRAVAAPDACCWKPSTPLPR